MNIKEVAYKVKDHLLTQNEKSIYITGECQYRGPNGLMCAVGCLIKDEFYDSTMEGMGADYDEVTDALIKSGVDDDYNIFNMLLELQMCHDDYSPSEWPERLDDIFHSYGINE